MRSAAVMPSDEISTIYIVGLPDDLREREFANMFMFAPGFEAAVLHYPALNGASSFNGTLSFHGASSVHGTSSLHGTSSSLHGTSSSLHGTSSSLHGTSSSLHGSAVTSASQRCSSASEAGNGESTSRSPSSPPTAASISSPASLLSFSTAANSNAGGSASDNAQMSDVEDFYAAVAGSSNSFHNFGISMGISSSAAALFGGDGNAATSAAVAATSAATANGSTSAATGLGSMTHRNQIIGFAKFETKHDALDARDHLNGRYIDMERGLVLKVELTKKNLFLRKPSIVAPLFSATTPTICPGGEHHHHHLLLHSSQDSMSSTAGISANAIVPPTSTTPASLAISTTASTPNGLGSASVISSSSQSALQAGTAAASIITATTSTTPMLTRSSTTIGTYNYNHHTRLTSTDYFGGYGMAASSRDYIPAGSTADLLSDDYFGLGCSSIHSGPGHVGSGNNGPTAAATLSNSQSSLSVASSSLANFGPNNGRNNCLAPGALIDPYSLLTANGNICCRPASTSSSDGYLSSSGLLAGSSMDRAAAITTATTTFNSSSNNTATSASFSNMPYGGNASAPMSSMTLSGTATSAAALNGGSNGLGATVLSSATAGGGGSASNSSQSSMRCMNISVPGHNTPLPISTPWRPASSVAVVPTVSSITPFRPFFPNSASLYPCNGVALTAQQQLLQHQQLQHQQLQKVMPAGPGQQIPGENPPCNTLYVGNLPMNASEDELRIIFATCAGYKRLSFRNKPNGPMCFVEFEDILCATAAMDGLYGTMLSTSTKGGIRLSFSKNPLGVRSCTPAI